MDWSPILDRAPAIITAIRDFVVAGAAISTATVGWKALNKWQDETVGKRRLEVAEDTLSAFYQVQQVIHDARTPTVEAHERASEDGVPEEVTSNFAYAPRRRLREASEKIVDLRTKRYRFAAVFDQRATEPWDEIEDVLREIDDACGSLLEFHSKTVTATDPYAEFYNKEHRIAFRSDKDDPIASQVADAVHAVEAICRPIISAWAQKRGARPADQRGRFTPRAR